MKKQFKICIIGLGYVGLPLLCNLGGKFNMIGFDLNKKRISKLKEGIDLNKEIKKKDILNKNILFTNNIESIYGADVYIICVPTPINHNKIPDLKLLKQACITVGKVIKESNLVIIESTVYPSTTDEICIPLLEKYSGLKNIKNNSNINKGFYVGYSPERINPGDKLNTVTNTSKLISSNSSKGLNLISKIYGKTIKGKLIKVNSIKECEASKIIENVQRDINIALMNEFSKIFRKMNLDVNSIINYANTKWNFSYYQPGLVGGHCIGVDPYYLAYISKKIGIDPKLILSGREINDNMYKQIIFRIKEIFNQKKINFIKSKILIMGYSFKENCPDIRNTQIEKIYKELRNQVQSIEIYDPMLKGQKTDNKFINFPIANKYNAILILVPHNEFLRMPNKIIKSFLHKKGFVFDLKSKFKNKEYYKL
tara:strand:- start:10858 stop:12132 length:1275 start_codon:yes stop_codon:yes gene_type:complete